MNKTDHFVIVGLGLLGGSYARGLSLAGYQNITAIDRDPASLEFAKEAGYIREGFAEGFEESLKTADYLILSLYPEDFVEWVKRYREFLPAGCILTDVCGVKSSIVDPVQALLPPEVEFIASHPMAGRELSGVQNCHLVDFSPANFLIVPTSKNTERGIAFARQLASVLGFAHIREIGCIEHDLMIGYVSQLTHAIAVSLMCQPDAQRFAPYTGDSFRDLTRIARINGPLWAQLFLANRDILIGEIDAFAGRLEQLKGYLKKDDRKGLEAMFRQSAEARAAFDEREKED